MIAHVPDQSRDWEPHLILRHQLIDCNPAEHDSIYSLMSHWDPDLHAKGNFVHVSPQLHLLFRNAGFRFLQEHALTGMRLYIGLDTFITLGDIGLNVTRSFVREDYFSLLGVNLYYLATTWSHTNLGECPSTWHCCKQGPLRATTLLGVDILQLVTQSFLLCHKYPHAK